MPEDNLEKMIGDVRSFIAYMRKLGKSNTPADEYSSTLKSQLDELSEQFNTIFFHSKFDDEIFTTLQEIINYLKMYMNSLPDDKNYRSNYLLVNSFYYFILYNIFMASTSEIQYVSSTAETLSQLLIGVPNVSKYIPEIPPNNFQELLLYMTNLESVIDIYTLPSIYLSRIDYSTWNNWVGKVFSYFYTMRDLFSNYKVNEKLIQKAIEFTDYLHLTMKRYSTNTPFFNLLLHLKQLSNDEVFNHTLMIQEQELDILLLEEMAGIRQFFTDIEQFKEDQIIDPDKDLTSIQVYNVLALILEDYEASVESYRQYHFAFTSSSNFQPDATLNKLIGLKNKLETIFGPPSHLLFSPFTNVYSRILFGISELSYLKYLVLLEIQPFSNWIKELGENLEDIDLDKIPEVAVHLAKSRIMVDVMKKNYDTSTVTFVEKIIDDIRFRTILNADLSLVLAFYHYQFDKLSLKSLIFCIGEIQVFCIENADNSHIVSFLEAYKLSLSSRYNDTDSKETQSEYLQLVEIRSSINPYDPKTWYFPKFIETIGFVPLTRISDKFIK